MPKSKSVYICQSCGAQSTNWVGQCKECGQWNTYVETVMESVKKSGSGKSGGGYKKPVSLSSVQISEAKRISSNIGEFDRVLGGGFVSGQVVLIAGDPGIGKSTLLTQIAKNSAEKKILYVCGEESVSQVKVRTERMNYNSDNLYLLSETDVEVIIEAAESTAKEVGLGLLIVDSIQTLTSEELTGMAGSVGQVRGCTGKLINFAKAQGVPIILVGHVTKEGTVAGPMVLEHMVDTVLYLEGDANHLYRILKTTKNRFGPVSEVGIFEITDVGMTEIANPSKLFLNDEDKNVSGSCITVVMEGYRPILFEIQALTVKTTFGYPKRTSSGYSINRLHVLIATVEKRCGINLSDYDVYLSVSGGYKVNEYSCDLAVCLAIISSIKDLPLKPNTIAFGECDLAGGVRKVPYQDNRLKESKKLGFKNLISPASVKTIKQSLPLAF